MLSNFHTWTEVEQKIFVAKIIHNINYSSKNLKLMETLVDIWDSAPIREAYFFQHQNTIKYASPSN